MKLTSRPEGAWVPPIESYYKVEADAYKIIFDRAQERFEDVMTESESITEKSLKMLTWLGALAGFLVGVEVKKEIGTPSIILSLVFFAIEAILLLLLIIPKQIKNRGLPPSVGMPAKLDTEEKEHQVQLVYFLHIVKLQDNVSFMIARNSRRVRLYRVAQIMIFVLGTAVGTVVTILLGSTLR